MIQRIWPLTLATPHLALGTPVEDALLTLKATGGSIVAETDGDGELFRVAVPTFEMAFYHKNGRVSSVWYNDPAGREFSLGRRRKLRLYMKRFTTNGKWDLRIDNGWMRFFFNDEDGACAVYGVHKDVIRINTS